MVLSQTVVQSLSMDILQFCCVDYLLEHRLLWMPVSMYACQYVCSFIRNACIFTF